MGPDKKRNTASIIFFGVIVVLLIVALWYFMNGDLGNNTAYTEFLDEFSAGKVSQVYVKGYYKIHVIYTDSRKTNVARDPDEIITIPSREQFWEDIKQITEAEGRTVSADIIDYNDPQQGTIWDYLVPLLTVAIGVVLVVFLFRAINKQNNQSINFGKSTARVTTNIKVRFTDVAGAEEEKEELAEVIDFLKSPKRFTELGARIPHGILLVGPPGTGKTLFAKAIAGEAGVPFFSISGSDFVEMFVGVGASRVRDLFESAKKNTPCIIFIDEIDAVGRQRGAGLGGGHDEREQTLNQLLVEMDGFETNAGVIVMAATNRQDILDPALLRPGRFDRQVYVNKPDIRGREAILRVHARNKPMAEDVDFRAVARITSGFTGADLENLLNEAAILAVRNHRKALTMADLNEGINKVIMGPAKKSRLVTEYDKRITAYHESGHAIIASSLKYCDPVHEVTIIPRGSAAGYTMTRPDNDNEHEIKQKLLDYITMALGGRIAEEIVIKQVSSGASQDIKNITKMAHQMVTEWGMSDVIGPLYYGSGGEVFVGKSYQTTKAYSEKMAGIIDDEIGNIVKECLERGRKILTEKTDILHTMAKVLFEKETIHSQEVEMILRGDSVEQVIDYMDSQDKKLQEISNRSTKQESYDIPTTTPTPPTSPEDTPPQP